MKSTKKSATNKLVDRFDNELRILLMNDLKAMKAKNNQSLQNAA